MTQQRLAELLADFVTAAKQLLISEERERILLGFRNDAAQLCSPEFMAEAWVPQFHDQVLAGNTKTAARRYLIARDFNEFDPDRADMLWLLQGGDK